MLLLRDQEGHRKYDTTHLPEVTLNTNDMKTQTTGKGRKHAMANRDCCTVTTIHAKQQHITQHTG